MFFISMAIGVGISACIFYPTVLALRTGKGGKFELEYMKNEFLGNAISVIQNHTVGATSQLGSAALFAGSLVLIGVISFFRSKKFTKNEKIIAGFAIVISLLTLYNQQLYFIFCLFKLVGSYVYRFSYVNIFVFCFLAAWFFCRYEEEKTETAMLLQNAVGVALFLLVLDYVHPIWQQKYVYYTAFAIVLIGLAIFWRTSKQKTCRIFATCFLFLIAFSEIEQNAKLLMLTYHSDESSNQYYQYVADMTNMADDIQTMDSDDYRLGQTVYRGYENNKISSHINDGFAYGLKTNACYTSCTEQNQLDLMNNFGYKMYANTLNVVNTSIIPMDSLLSVKYVASDYPIQGLLPLDEFGPYDNKKLYENPYALPMVYTVHGSNHSVEYDQNSFTYVNELYQILGENQFDDVFRQLDYTQSTDNTSISFVLNVDQAKDAIYGNILMDDQKNVELYVNGTYWMDYAKWLTSSVFYVPVSDGDQSVTVTLVSDTPMKVHEVQFYSVDTSALQQYHNFIMDHNTVSDLKITNGLVTCKAIADKNTWLQTSVPENSGWKLSVNGNVVTSDSFADCFIRIPLTEGENTIEMTYSIPGIKEGILGTLASIAVLIFIEFLLRKKKIR